MNKHILLRIESEDADIILKSLYLAKTDMHKNLKRLEDMRLKYIREYDNGRKWVADRVIQHTELRIKKQKEQFATLEKYIDALSFAVEGEKEEL